MNGGPSWERIGIGLCLLASAVALGVAPLLMPADYSWVQHTTSESAAQGVAGAWLPRLGFVLFGVAALALAGHAKTHWERPARAFHTAFGVGMLGTASFSTRPWWSGAAYNATEDLLHSVFATLVGVGFALGVLIVVVRRRRHREPFRRLDAVALVAALGLPPAMLLFDPLSGAIQRGMFVVAYAWYAREALTTNTRS